MSTATIALLTDFGFGDWYIGVMKAVILSVNPRAAIVDILHSIPKHNVAAASFAVLASYKYLPEGTVIVIVVDPGVGTDRKILCVRSAGRFFLAPDNGVLTGVLGREDYERLVCVENDKFFLKPVSSTFHGRDIFAPVAGHLSLGLDPAELGRDAVGFERIRIPGPRVEAGRAVLTVQWVDAFGNLITDCPEDLIGELQSRWGSVTIDVGRGRAVNLVDSYEGVNRGEVLAIIGSSGYLEISVREGSAGDVLGLGIGNSIEITKEEMKG